MLLWHRTLTDIISDLPHESDLCIYPSLYLTDFRLAEVILIERLYDYDGCILYPTATVWMLCVHKGQGSVGTSAAIMTPLHSDKYALQSN